MKLKIWNRTTLLENAKMPCNDWKAEEAAAGLQGLAKFTIWVDQVAMDLNDLIITIIINCILVIR